MLTILALVAAMVPSPTLTRVQVGDPAPDFALPASNGKSTSLAAFRGKKAVVLAFFPKAFTGGCTREMQAYGGLHPQFTKDEAEVFGVSMDDADTLKRFATELNLPFTLLSDAQGEASKAYGVLGQGRSQRVTFVIDRTGKVVEVFEGQAALDPSTALQACRTKKPETK